MGLNKDTGGGSGGNILTVKRGALCLESKTEIEGWVHIEDDVDGRPYEKWIQKFGSVDGMITEMYWYDEQPADIRYQGIKVRIEDGDESYLLDLPYDKKAYNAFVRFAENIDFTKPVEFMAWPDREDPRATGFCAKQDGQVVRQKYTKAFVESGETDCPPAKVNKVTNKYNFADQNEWLLNNLLENVIPKLGTRMTGGGEATSAHEEPKPKKGKAKGVAATASTKKAEDRWANVEDPIHSDE